MCIERHACLHAYTGETTSAFFKRELYFPGKLRVDEGERVAREKERKGGWNEWERESVGERKSDERGAYFSIKELFSLLSWSSRPRARHPPPLSPPAVLLYVPLTLQLLFPLLVRSLTSRNIPFLAEKV